MYYIRFNRVARLGHSIYRNVSKRNINTLSYINKRVNKSVIDDSEQVTRYIESLALANENRIDIIEDSTYKFNNYINKLYPLQIIRALNAYSNLDYSNENILKAVLTRNDEMCANSSPKRALELMKLYETLNISHEEILKELTKSLIKHMNNYSYELYNMGLNASYLNIDDPVFVESYKTQVSLNVKELSQLNRIKMVASFSRMRVECAEILEILWNSINKNNLDIKKNIMLMAIFARFNDERYKIILNNLKEYINSNELSIKDISTILTVQKTNRVVSTDVIEGVINWMEMKMKDQQYIKSEIIYHLFMLAQLAPKKMEKQIWKIYLDQIFKNIEGYMNPTKMIQLLKTIAILKSDKIIENSNEQIISHIKSCYQKLSIKQQNQMYDAIYELYENSNDYFFERIMRESKPNKLPLMYGNMKNIELGKNKSKYLLYERDKDNKLMVNKCVVENDVINIVNKKLDVVLSPTMLLDLNVIKKLHKNTEEFNNEIKIVVLNNKLKKLLK